MELISVRRVRFLVDSAVFLGRALLRMETPFFGGIVINDLCNLHCSYCTVANRHIPDMSFDEIRKALRMMYGMGMRNLYLEGGEPFLWREGEKRLDDVVRLCHEEGFHYVTVFTNGMLPIETVADSVFVSLDGWGEVNDVTRGKSFERVIGNIRKSTHKRIVVSCTVTSKNKDTIEDFCEHLKYERTVRGVLFFFYTPYNRKDELRLSEPEKRRVLDQMLEMKRKGLPIVNSRAAIKSVRDGDWKRPNKLCWIYTDHKLYQCCRLIEDRALCEECGYVALAELFHVSRLHPEALWAARKYL